MSLFVVDDPPGRPAWLRETIVLLTARSDQERGVLQYGAHIQAHRAGHTSAL